MVGVPTAASNGTNGTGVTPDEVLRDITVLTIGQTVRIKFGGDASGFDRESYIGKINKILPKHLRGRFGDNVPQFEIDDDDKVKITTGNYDDTKALLEALDKIGRVLTPPLKISEKARRKYNLDAAPAAAPAVEASESRAQAAGTRTPPDGWQEIELKDWQAATVLAAATLENKGKVAGTIAATVGTGFIAASATTGGIAAATGVSAAIPLIAAVVVTLVVGYYALNAIRNSHAEKENKFKQEIAISESDPQAIAPKGGLKDTREKLTNAAIYTAVGVAAVIVGGPVLMGLTGIGAAGGVATLTLMPIVEAMFSTWGMAAMAGLAGAALALKPDKAEKVSDSKADRVLAERAAVQTAPGGAVPGRS